MVENKDTEVNKLKKVMEEFVLFLENQSESSILKADVKKFTNFVKEKNESIKIMSRELTDLNLINIESTVRVVCRCFSDFNWFDDMNFYNKAGEYLDNLSETSERLRRS